MIGDLDQLGRVVGGLIVVLISIALVARIARRAGGQNGGSGLRIVERIGLSREANLAVVEISDRKMLLGVTPQGVTMLADIQDASDPQQTEQFLEEVASSRRAGGRRRNRADSAVAGAVKASLRRQLGLKDRKAQEPTSSRRRATKHGRKPGDQAAQGWGVTVPTTVATREPGIAPAAITAPAELSAPENIDMDELRESEYAAQELAAAFGTPAPAPAEAVEQPIAQPVTRPDPAPEPAPVDALLIDVRDSFDSSSSEPSIQPRPSGRRAAGPPQDAAPTDVSAKPRSRAENRASLREAPAEDEPTPLPGDLNMDEYPDLATALRAAGRTSTEPRPRPAPVPTPAATLQRPAPSFRPQMRPRTEMLSAREDSLSEQTARQVAAFQAEAYPGAQPQAQTRRAAQGRPESAPRPTPAPRAHSVLPQAPVQKPVHQTRAQAQGRIPAQVPAQPSGRRSQQQDPQVNGSALSPRTWRQGVDALRDLTVRRG